MSRDCKKAKKDFKDRSCFNCGEPGHQSKDCPKKAASVRTLQEEPRDGAGVFIGCLGDDEGYIPVHRAKNLAAARRRFLPPPDQPEPRGCCLGECIKSAFTRLEIAARPDPDNSPSVNLKQAQAREAPARAKSKITENSGEPWYPHC